MLRKEVMSVCCEKLRTAQLHCVNKIPCFFILLLNLALRNRISLCVCVCVVKQF
jgi:hypothetical protein